MGRTLVVRAFLFAVILVTITLQPVARAETAHGPDDWDELQSWLSQLCFVVNCEIGKTPDEESGEQSEVSVVDMASVQFILSFQTNGVRPDLTLDERNYARAAVLRTSRLLAENAGRLDPEVEKALDFTLACLRAELGK
jgi:hypothetical protein